MVKETGMICVQMTALPYSRRGLTLSPRAFVQLLSENLAHWDRESVERVFLHYMIIYSALNETLAILLRSLSYQDITHNEDITGYRAGLLRRQTVRR